jgi:hypothetical protein
MLCGISDNIVQKGVMLLFICFQSLGGMIRTGQV